ncbi:MAG: hypothetical protein ABSE77_17205 [Acidimicrobiales bacterium]
MTARDDAQSRGLGSEVARHERVVASIESLLRRLQNSGEIVALT